jgi:hypothetical protein
LRITHWTDTADDGVHKFNIHKNKQAEKITQSKTMKRYKKKRQKIVNFKGIISSSVQPSPICFDPIRALANARKMKIHRTPAKAFSSKIMKNEWERKKS